MSDYRNAVVTASNGSIARMPFELCRVVISRAIFGFGPRWYSLYSFDRVPVTSWSSYLKNEALKKRLRQENGVHGRSVVRDKLRFFLHCRDEGIKTIPVLAVVGAEELPPSAKSLWVSESTWDEISTVLPGRLFVKRISGSGGVDAMALEREGDAWRCGTRLLTSNELYRHLQDNRGRGWIVQPRIENHPAMKSLMPGDALGTLRIVTIRKAGGGVYASICVVRIPVGMSSADNFGHGVSGNFVAAVDLESGRIKDAMRSRSTTWPAMEKVTEHPVTRQLISGFQIPFWQEANELVIRAHESLADMTSIGWDVAITDDGPVIVEGNGQYDIDLLQVAFQRGVKDELRALWARTPE